ncbi:hypothetical protein BDZ91DRAFT_232036 [Kalaharituber pfeilii]|nr:hypothetical protein BDZ91DRAFT_232036 [Kalaharituber pfeilii]
MPLIDSVRSRSPPEEVEVMEVDDHLLDAGQMEEVKELERLNGSIDGVHVEGEEKGGEVSSSGTSTEELGLEVGGDQNAEGRHIGSGDGNAERGGGEVGVISYNSGQTDVDGTVNAEHKVMPTLTPTPTVTAASQPAHAPASTMTPQTDKLSQTRKWKELQRRMDVYKEVMEDTTRALLEAVYRFQDASKMWRGLQRAFREAGEEAGIRVDVEQSAENGTRGGESVERERDSPASMEVYYDVSDEESQVAAADVDGIMNDTDEGDKMRSGLLPQRAWSPRSPSSTVEVIGANVNNSNNSRPIEREAASPTPSKKISATPAVDAMENSRVLSRFKRLKSVAPAVARTKGQLLGPFVLETPPPPGVQQSQVSPAQTVTRPRHTAVRGRGRGVPVARRSKPLGFGRGGLNRESSHIGSSYREDYRDDNKDGPTAADSRSSSPDLVIKGETIRRPASPNSFSGATSAFTYPSNTCPSYPATQYAPGREPLRRVDMREPATITKYLTGKEALALLPLSPHPYPGVPHAPEAFSRHVISAVLGGSTQNTFCQPDMRKPRQYAVPGYWCVKPALNPNLPVHPMGNAVLHVLSSEVGRLGQDYPLFIRRGANEWLYYGTYHTEGYYYLARKGWIAEWDENDRETWASHIMEKKWGREMMMRGGVITGVGGGGGEEEDVGRVRELLEREDDVHPQIRLILMLMRPKLWDEKLYEMLVRKRREAESEEEEAGGRGVKRRRLRSEKSEDEEEGKGEGGERGERGENNEEDSDVVVSDLVQPSGGKRRWGSSGVPGGAGYIGWGKVRDEDYYP